MTSQDLISLNCEVCSTALCISTNAFLAITPSLVTADNRDLFTCSGLESLRHHFLGLDEFEGSSLSALICAVCDLRVGEKCVKVAKGEKAWMKGRCFLDLSKFIAKSVTTQSIVNLNIKTHDTTSTHSVATTSKPKARHTQHRTTVPKPAVRMAENGNSTQAARSPATLSEINKENEQLTGTLAMLKEIQQNVLTLQKDLAESRASQAQHAAQTDSSVQNMQKLTDNVSKVSDRLNEVDLMKVEVSHLNAKQHQTSTQVTFGLKHLGQIVEQVSQIDRRLSDVDSLKQDTRNIHATEIENPNQISTLTDSVNCLREDLLKTHACLGELDSIKSIIAEIEIRQAQQSDQISSCMEHIRKLTEDISGANRRLAEMDSLKQEIQTFRQRIAQIEDWKQSPRAGVDSNSLGQAQATSHTAQDLPATPATTPPTSTSPDESMPPPLVPASTSRRHSNKALPSISIPDVTPLSQIRMPITKARRYTSTSPPPAMSKAKPRSSNSSSTEQETPKGVPPDDPTRDKDQLSPSDARKTGEGESDDLPPTKRRRSESNMSIPSTPKPRGRPPKASFTPAAAEPVAERSASASRTGRERKLPQRHAA